jgi:cell division protein FtsL
MTRLNLILYFALMLSALGLVNAQHKSRKLYIELEQMSQAAKQYEQEYGQLQLEQSTWAMHSRVELIAAHTLQMQVPDAKRIQVVSPNDLPAQMPQTNVQSTGQVVPQSGASQ